MIVPKVLECVPNFSEGRDRAIIEPIVEAIANSPGVLLAGWEMDPDHNRSVVTFAGRSMAVVEGAVRGVERAAKLIDLSLHKGVHPRVGAADVVPFIPLSDTTMPDAATAAYRAGAKIWQDVGVPVYFYGAAARVPSRARLETVRKRGFDGLPADLGDQPHPTAGASMVGARDFLIAYNVLLDTDDLAIAQGIARTIRESAGGFKHVKALGLYLENRGRAQVSMNLTNFAQTDLNAVYEAIAQHAPVASSEIIGFVPQAAFDRFPEFFRRAENFAESRILEKRLAELA